MRESSLSCRARSDLASSPCSEPTPIELASPWLGRLTGRLEGRQPAGWHGTASGSSTPPPPRMPSGGRGGVSGPATGARASEELWPVTARAQRTSCRHRLAFRFCCRLQPRIHAASLGSWLSAGLHCTARACASTARATPTRWRHRCWARACARRCCSRPSGRRPCDCNWAVRPRCAAAAAAGTPM